MLSASVMFYSTADSMSGSLINNLCSLMMLVAHATVSIVFFNYCRTFLFNCLSFVLFSG